MSPAASPVASPAASFAASLAARAAASSPAPSAARQRPLLHRPARAAARAAARPPAQLWRPFAPRELDLVCLRAGGVHAVPAHTHERVAVLLPLRAVSLADGAAAPRAVHPGQLAVVPAGRLHALAGGDAWELAALLVDPRILPVAAAGTVVLDDRPLHDALAALVGALQQPVRAGDAADRARDALAALAARLAALPVAADDGEPTRTTAGVRRALAHLRAHVAESVELDDLAGVAYLSKYYLLRAFTREVGLSPHACHMQLKLARARRLLEAGHGVTDATYAAGFADQSHLTRRFHEFHGFTPAAYVRALAAGSLGQAPAPAARPGEGTGAAA